MLTTSLLKKSKTPAILMTEIVMTRAAFKGFLFLVEGDDDSRFWRARIARDGTSIVICEGKKNLVGLSHLVTSEGIPQLVGVYDSDFEHLFGIVHCPNILTRTDENDLEVTLLASQALRSLLHEYADPHLLSAFESKYGTSPIDHLESMAKEFGKLRLINNQLGHCVSFDRLSPHRFIARETWTLDLAGLHSEYAKIAGIANHQLQDAFEKLIPETKAWGLCHGHDSMHILAIGLREVIGRRQLDDKAVASALRLAFSFSMLEQSEMYKALIKLGGSQASQIFVQANPSA